MMKEGQHISPHNQSKTTASLPGLTARVIGFGYFLKQRGFRVYQSGIQDALKSLASVDIHQKDEFFDALRANLVSSDLEWIQFPGLFQEYWDRIVEEGKQEGGEEEARESQPGQQEEKADKIFSSNTKPEEESKEGTEQAWIRKEGYSPVSSVEKVDVGKFDKEDIAVAQLALKKIMNSFMAARTRRMRRTPRRRSLIDFSRVARKSLKYEGIPMELFYREKKKRLKRLVILADVSGSMERYARFVIPFLLGLRGVGPRAEVFVFSTTLAHVTRIVRHLEVEKALGEMVKKLPEWSGGTRIGHSLHQFNQRHGASLLSRRTVVLILSDGWDLGAKELLRREMARLSAKAYCTIWLNPLAGDPAFQPICRGMVTVMPYVDYLLPVATLENLKRVGHVLSKVMAH